MLKTILSISGRPGLYQLLTNSKNMIIVESLQDGRKIPVHARDRIVSLGDISIYTNANEVPLKDVLLAMKKKEEGKPCSVAPNSSKEILTKYFEEILPDFDQDRVHASDIKKIITWYNILIHATKDFDKEENSEVADEQDQKTEE